MPPRLTYFTGIWDPAREALSKEVSALRRFCDPDAPVVSFSAGQRSRFWPRDRVVRLSGKRELLLRGVAAALELRGDVTHVFGAMDAWHLLRAVGRRPVVFTVGLPGATLPRALLDKVAVFAVESEVLAAELRRAGVAGNRVQVVYPGVDLELFRPAAMPAAHPFRLLFASTPSDPREFEARGIPLLVELARSMPDIEVVFLWRQWGSRSGATRALQALCPPPNLIIEQVDSLDMPAVFASVHATACCFADGFGKSCPNSVIESIAAGRPVMLSDTSGVAGLVAARNAGVVSPRTLTGCVQAIERLRSDLDTYGRNARQMAEQCFDVDDFYSTYSTLYAQLASSRQDRLVAPITEPNISATASLDNSGPSR